MVKGMGFMGNNYRGDDRIVMVAPADTAAAAAEKLTTPATGHNVHYVASDDRTAPEIAHVSGAAIGRPELTWAIFNDEQTQTGLEKSGMPAQLTASLIELGAGIHSGVLRQDYDRHKPTGVLGKVKPKDFAREFAARFQQG